MRIINHDVTSERKVSIVNNNGEAMLGFDHSPLKELIYRCPKRRRYKYISSKLGKFSRVRIEVLNFL